MRMRTLLVATLMMVLVAIAAAPAWAGDSQYLAFTEGESESEEVVEDTGSELGIVPAVDAPPAAEEESDRPWTQRFLAPTVLALGVLGLIGTFIYYGVRVRGKYRVAS